jgi:hypothetical protein
MPGRTDRPVGPGYTSTESGDGEIVKERCVGPLAGVVTHQVHWRIGRRTEAGRDGGQAQVGEDLPDNRRAFDHGKDLHRPAAAGTHEGIHLVDSRMRRAQKRRTSRGARLRLRGTGSVVSASLMACAVSDSLAPDQSGRSRGA